MSFWSGKKLTAALPNRDIIRGFDPKNIDCAAYTLTLGREAYVTPDHKTLSLAGHKKEKLELKDQVKIPAGQFAFLLTEEYLRMPKNVVAFISLRSSYKMQGLINVSGFHVDPGFHGNLVYGVYNAGTQTIILEQGSKMFLIWFSDLVGADAKEEQSHHYNPDFRDYKEEDPQTNISAKLVNGMTGQIYSLQTLQREIEKLHNKIFRMTVFWGMILAGILYALTLFVNRYLRENWDTFFPSA